MPITIPDLAFAGDRALTAAQAQDVEAKRLEGHFALHRRRGAVHELVRDPLGVHKLFFALTADGEVHSSNYLWELREAGHEPARIWSVPSGHRLLLNSERRELSLEKISTLPFGQDDAAVDEPRLERHAAEIRQGLDRTFSRLAEALRGERLFVTLSGGLDSTGIAVLAREHLGDFTAVTFAVEGDDGRGGDLAAARGVAEALGVELLEVRRDPAELVDRLDEVLRWGQDWRDFNVHCGLVNDALARALPEGAVVLTGDGMNELMADYSPVHYRGHVLYDLPRLSAGRLRRFLVQGLDSGDREVGIFWRRGVRTVQPYLLCAGAYTAWPAAFVASERSKQRLVERVLGERVPRFVYERPKVRAQVGSSDEVSGTVAALLERGFDSDRLAERFRRVFDLTERDQRRLVRAGFYRFPTQWPPIGQRT